MWPEQTLWCHATPTRPQPGRELTGAPAKMCLGKPLSLTHTSPPDSQLSTNRLWRRIPPPERRRSRIVNLRFADCWYICWYGARLQIERSFISNSYASLW